MKKTPRFLLISSLLGSTLGQVQADSGTWTKSATGGLWSGIGNWTAGTIADGSGFTADFNTLDIAADNTVHLDAPHTLASLTFGDINTGTAAGWILDNSGDAANILTLDPAPTITVNGLGTGKNVTISAEVAGLAGLTKAGVGTLVLTGANTYTWDTVVTGGTLKFSGGGFENGNNLYVGNGAGTTGAMIMDGTVGTLNFTGGGYPNGLYVGHDGVGTLDVNAGILSAPGGDVTIASKNVGTGGSIGTVTVDGGSIATGRLIIADDMNSTGSVVLKSGSISVTGPIIFGGGGATSYANGSLEVRGGTLITPSVFRYSGVTTSTFILNGGTVQATATNGGFFGGGITYKVQEGGAKFDTNGFDITVGQVLAHAGAAPDGGLVKSGTGALRLGDKNTINGNVLVSGGALELTGGANFGTNPLGANLAGRTVTVEQGTALRTLTTDSIDYFSDVVNNLAFTIRGTWENNPANTTDTGFQRVDNLALEGATIADRGQHGAGYGAILMAGTVNVGGSAPSTYNQLDGGVGLSILNTTFNVANVTGNADADFTINGGIRQVPALGVGNLTKSGTGTLTITGTSSYAGATNINDGTVTVGGAGTLGNAGYVADITLAANGSTLNFASSAAQTCFGTISGSGSVIQSGTGVFTLLGDNSYTGPTSVTAGTLQVDGHIEGSAITVAAGGTVGGSGGVGSVVISANGNIAPGSAETTGYFGASSAAIAGHLKIDHDGSQSPTCDVLEVTGNLDISSATVDFNRIAGALSGPAHVFASYGSLTGSQFAAVTNLPAGYAISYHYNGSNQIALVSDGSATAYQLWAASKGLSDADDDVGADPDKDGRTNLIEFGFDGNPLSGAADGKTVAKVANVGAVTALTLTLPVRTSAVFPPNNGPLSSTAAETIAYAIKGSTNLATWTLAVVEVPPANIGTLQDNLPALSPGYSYHSFYLPNSNPATNPKAFIRAEVVESP